MSLRRLMVIGAGHEQVPALHMARRMGLHTVVTDRNPSAPGVALADVFEPVSTHDAAGNLAVARRHAIDGVMTVGSETAVPVVAHLASVLGLPGLSEDCAHKATHKNAMRQAFEAHGVPCPASQPVGVLAQALAFAARHPGPWVLKPSDCSGQRGVSLVDHAAGIAPAFAAAVAHATDAQAIIETFCAGPEINVTAVVQGGQVHLLSMSERVTAAPPHFGIAIEHLAPPALSAAALEAVAEASRRAIHAIGLTDGIAYPQVIATPSGASVIEIAARIPGGHMARGGLATVGHRPDRGSRSARPWARPTRWAPASAAPPRRRCRCASSPSWTTRATPAVRWCT